MDVYFSNDLEKLQKAIAWYSLMTNLFDGKDRLRPRLIEVLAYYVKLGYSSRTKDFILQSIPSLKRTNLNQINSDLQRSGYLVKDKMNESLRHLNPSLQKLKDFLESGDDLLMLMNLKNYEKTINKT